MATKPPVGNQAYSPHHYVATTGSDVTGDGSAARPWATIDHARQYLRNRYDGGGNTMTADEYVHVAAGDYWETSVTFTDADKGRNGHRINYVSDTLGGARLLGGKVIGSWAVYAGNIYRAPVTGNFWTMWEDGVRGICARTPKLTINADYPCALAGYFNSDNSAVYTELIYKPSEVDPTPWVTTGLQLLSWSGIDYNWFTETTKVNAINLGVPYQFTLDHQTKFKTASSRWFAQGLLQFLTAAGEWYHDVAGGYLYYWPRGGGAPGEIVVPTTTSVLAMNGTRDSRVSGLTFSDFEVAYSDFDSWFRYAFYGLNADHTNPPIYHQYPEYVAEYSSTNCQFGAVKLSNTSDIEITRCRIRRTGFSGIYLQYHAQDNEITDCWIEHTGVHGIHFEGQYPAEGDINKNNTVDNVRINNVGELVGHGAGIWIAQSGGNTISHFDIHDGPRCGIFITSYINISPTSYVYARGNAISYGKLTDLCQDSNDVGSLTFAFFSSTGVPYIVNTVNQVVIAGANAHPTAAGVPPNGLFFDFQSMGQEISNMLVSDTQGAAKRDNAGNQVFTNVSFTGSFDQTLLAAPYGNAAGTIGTTGAFPWA